MLTHWYPEFIEMYVFPPKCILILMSLCPSFIVAIALTTMSLLSHNNLHRLRVNNKLERDSNIMSLIQYKLSQLELSCSW